MIVAYYFHWINEAEGWWSWIADGGRRRGRAGSLEEAAEQATGIQRPRNIQPQQDETNRIPRKP